MTAWWFDDAANGAFRSTLGAALLQYLQPAEPFQPILPLQDTILAQSIRHRTECHPCQTDLGIRMQPNDIIRAVGLLILAACGATQTRGQVPAVDLGPGAREAPRVARWAGRDAPRVETVMGQQSATAPRPATTLLPIADLESMALGNNPTLAQAQRQIQALRGKYVQQGLYPNPVLGYIGEEIGDEGRAGQQGVVLGQKVITAGKLDLNRAVVSHEIAAAQQDLEIQRQRIINDVPPAAYEVLTTQRTIALSEQLVRIGQEGQEVAEELLKAREVSQVDLLQARIEANSAKVLLANAPTSCRRTGVVWPVLLESPTCSRRHYAMT